MARQGALNATPPERRRPASKGRWSLWVRRAAAPLLLAALAAQAGWFILAHSNTADELAYIGAGVSYVRTGRLQMDIWEHPPLIKYLIGLALSGVSPDAPLDSQAFRGGHSYAFGHEFLYGGASSPERILALARLPSLLLSLALGALVFAWSRLWFGEWGGALALALYAFEPSIVAHSGLAVLDIGLSLFLTAAAFRLVVWLESSAPSGPGGGGTPRAGRDRASGPIPDLLPASWTGAFAGAAVASKLTGAIFFLWAPGLLWGGPRPAAARRGVWFLAVAGLSAAAVLALAYQVRWIPEFIEMGTYRFRQAFSGGAHQELPIFLRGEVSSGGWRTYYLWAMLVKPTLPFLAAVALGAASKACAGRRWALLWPSLSLLVVASLSAKQALRYVLPAFPLLCVAGGALAAGGPRARALAAVLALWHAGEGLRIAPHYLAHFNQIAGGPSEGYRWLSDLDWGQDTAKLGRWLRREGSPEVIVASFSNADRDSLLGRRQDLLDEPAFRHLRYRHVNSPEPERELLAVGASVLQEQGLAGTRAFAWLIESRRPIARVGHTVFVYDVTADAASHHNMGWIYARNGLEAFARREFERSARLAPGDPRPREGLRWLKERAAGTPSPRRARGP